MPVKGAVQEPVVVVTKKLNSRLRSEDEERRLLWFLDATVDKQIPLASQCFGHFVRLKRAPGTFSAFRSCSSYQFHLAQGFVRISTARHLPGSVHCLLKSPLGRHLLKLIWLETCLRISG